MIVFGKLTNTYLVSGLSLIMIGIVGILDWITGYEIAFSIFYFIPLSLLALYQGTKRTSIIINSFVAAAVWFIADFGIHKNYSHFLIPYWNGLAILITFTGVGLLLYTLKKQFKSLQISNQILNDRNQQIRGQNRKIEKLNSLLNEELDRTDKLLLNILPAEIAKELKEKRGNITREYEKCTVMFTDFKDFVKLTGIMKPDEIIEELDYYFSSFDDIISKYDIEKIKTIGDAYMCVGGVPVPNDTNPVDILLAAIEINNFINDYREVRIKQNKPYFEARIGVHTGHLIAGVVGKTKFSYDVWGDTVNVASRLEKSGEPGKINISEETFLLVEEYFECSCRGQIAIKNRGEIDMYFIGGIRQPYAEEGSNVRPNRLLLSKSSFKA